MKALEEREKEHLDTVSENAKLLIIKSPKEPLKVIVNNYKQKEKTTDKKEKEIVETMNMPPQPGGYIKYSNHDLF